MDYTKPTVTVLGEASEVIEQTGPITKQTNAGDGSKPVDPAYDLDD